MAVVSSDGMVSDGCALKAVFFDFDSTLSMPQFIKRAGDYAVADRVELCMGLEDDEVFANFGGAARVGRIRETLERLRSHDVTLFIISLGVSRVIRHHLDVVGLGEFFASQLLFGQDSPRLARAGHKKAVLIQQLLQEHSMEPEDALFVDDSRTHIQLCRRLGACDVFQVEGNGLTPKELDALDAR
eukprot:CAMPEP_0170251110 /NCGR_PEP_ID=MMETSP0116_2-20130129/25384_1 /TAXON_ID=400756 /ORGANISM="Durinskia baltica, Strain CSIRO CS-38" /LENGTH=185 /DNA_ID=CAMNT_0010502071 /DNA_START=125 /DNA_END=678 /DNA_ORIENTATION=-